MRHVIFALFPDVERARAAVADVRALGIGEERMNVVVHEDALNPDTLRVRESDAREGLASGAIIGALSGGLAVGAVALLGPIALVGAEVAVVVAAGVAAGGAYGALGATLVGSAMPDRALETWRAELKAGRVVLTVTTEAREDEQAIEEAFQRHGVLELRRQALRRER
jgi:hypothetical protein